MPVVVVIKTPEEAEGLMDWARRFTVALKVDQLIVLSTELKRADFHEAIVSAVGQAGGKTGAFEEEIERVEGPNPYAKALARIRELDPELLVVGKQQSERRNEVDAKFARGLFEHAPCSTLLLRLGETAGNCARILVPVSGGPHAIRALRLAAAAVPEEGEVSALFVEPDAGQDADDVGERILVDLIYQAGIPTGQRERLKSRVVVSNNVADSIRQVTEEECFDLLIMGAPRRGKLRQALFGTVPDRLMKGENSLDIGVLRGARPMTQRVRERLERWLHVRVPQLNREARVELVEKIQTNSRWSFDFMILITLSTLIASFGLIQNSTAVVIGAMLVAPLMTPLLGGGLALVQGNLPLMRSCVRAIVYGFCAALVVGWLSGLVAPIGELTSELASRGGPTLLDMGVAFASGVAASYCIARPGLSSALAGVAIAAALVPPIATVGISVALGETANALGATLLFATNVVAIVLGAALNFFANGIRAKVSEKRRVLWASRSLLGLMLVAAALAVPLGSVLVSKVASSGIAAKEVVTAGSFHEEAAQIIEAGSSSRLRAVSVKRLRDPDSILLIFRVEGQTDLDFEVLDRLQQLGARRYPGMDPDLEIQSVARAEKKPVR